ncbi:MAG: hypothetical protein HGA25_07545, partial [Clostridiales bacterium]|nr:hypothetical protein [Clostridiales bacterium]
MKKFILITIFLTMISAFFITSTVKGQSTENNKEQAAYYDQVESDYLVL